MGFMGGVITGVALAAGAAAWYMSRSGERFRDQYRVDRKLGELGDQLELRTREIQSTVNAQLAEMRAKGTETASATGGESASATVGESASATAGEAEGRLDAAQASAAEAAAELAADVEAKAAKIKKSAKNAASE